MNLEPIVDFIHQAGVAKKAETLFAYNMPNVDFGVLVLSKTPISIHPYHKGRYEGTFQIVVRGRQAEEVLGPAGQLIALLNGEGIEMGNMRFLTLTPLHTPMLFPRSDGNMLEASVNFSFTYIDI